MRSQTSRHLAELPQAVPERFDTYVSDDLAEVDDGPEDLLEVEAAALADESLKISNCNLSPATVQVRRGSCLTS